MRKPGRSSMVCENEILVADSTNSSSSTGQSTPTGTTGGRALTIRGISVPLNTSSGSMFSSTSLAPTRLHHEAYSLTFRRKVAQMRPFLPAPIEAGPPFSNPKPARTALVVVSRVASDRRAPTSGPIRPVYRIWRPLLIQADVHQHQSVYAGEHPKDLGRLNQLDITSAQRPCEWGVHTRVSRSVDEEQRLFLVPDGDAKLPGKPFDGRHISPGHSLPPGRDDDEHPLLFIEDAIDILSFGEAWKGAPVLGRLPLAGGDSGLARACPRKQMSEGSCGKTASILPGDLFDNTVYVSIALPHVVAGAADHSQQPDSIGHAHQHEDIERRPPFEGCECCPQEAPPIG